MAQVRAGRTTLVKTVLVTVGTDHHPFDRLMQWVESMQATTTDLHFVVQHGSSEPPAGVEAHAMMDVPQLTQAMRMSDLVVSHGGPASIFDAHNAGRQPIVVPRESQFGEHVDNHQVRFATRLADDGVVRLARTEEQFRAAVQAGLSFSRHLQVAKADPGSEAAIARFRDLVDRLLDRG